MKRAILNTFNSIGIQINRYPDSDLKRRLKLIKYFEINKIFDIGANVGNYAMVMRRLGFLGNIVSFEPLSETFKKLQKNAVKDNNWEAINIALGNKDGESEINIAGNNDSSSILEMMPLHSKSAPESSYIGKERIKVNKLDTVFDMYCEKGDNVFVKIDTQGYELNVLQGAEKSLSHIKGIQIEMSLVQLYDGGILYKEMIELIEKKGFSLFSIENGFSDPGSGELLQMDGIFFKK